MVIISPSYLDLGGITLTALEASGVQWITETVDGWEGSPSSTLKGVQRPRGHGSWAGNAYFTERSVAAAGRVFAPTAALLSDAIDRLNNAVALDDQVLTVTESGRTRHCVVRRAGDVISSTTDLVAAWSIQVVSLDPRKLGATKTASTQLPSTSGGLTVPFTVPFSIDATQVSGQVMLTNSGNTAGPVTARIDGPCVGPVVTHKGANGGALVFAASLVLGAGEWLDIDYGKRQVLANGQASRNGYITARGWSTFEPGANTWSFTAASYTAGAQLTITATSADK